MSKPTLLEQLALLSNPTPADLDPELAYSSLSSSKNAQIKEDDGLGSDDDKGGRDHYLDVGSSSLRKKADQHKETLEDDIKYGGERRSRKQIFDDDNEDDDDDDLSDDGEEGAQDDEDENMEIPDRDEEDQDEEEEEDSSSDDGGQPHASTSSTQLQEAPSLETTQILSSIRQSRSEDLAKGLGVKRQLELFEKVMPLRIRLQKAVVGIEEVKAEDLRVQMENASPETKEMLASCLDELRTFSEGMFELREGLLRLNDPTLSAPPSKRRKLSKSDATDPAAYIPAAIADALALSDLTHPSLIINLHKWSSKILSAQGLSSLLPRDKFRAVRIGTVEQVSASLSGMEGTRKINRFREGEGLDKTGRGDREFYQSLVRDVIERKGSGGGLGVSSAAPALPNRLPKVRKATLDTRASKGRKLRFIPHEKIMNFMVPVQMEGVGGGWHDEQVDELFGSLLGKRVEDDDEGEEQKEVGLAGLRVF